MAMIHKKPGFFTGCRKPDPVRHIIQTPLEHTEQILSRNTLLPFGLGERSTELALKDAVNALQFLLFAKLSAVLRHSLTTLPMLSRRVRTTFHGAFFGHAAGALQKQLNSFSTAQPTHGSTIFSHGSFPFVNRYPLYVKRGIRIFLRAYRLTLHVLRLAAVSAAGIRYGGSA
jgi:hypothetical protein